MPSTLPKKVLRTITMGRKAHYVGRDGEGEVRTFDDWIACSTFSHGQPGGQAGNFRCDTEVEMAAEWLRAHPTTNIAAAKSIWTEEYKKLQQNPDAASVASPHKSRSFFEVWDRFKQHLMLK